jgi:preprotein translocase subunit SecY
MPYISASIIIQLLAAALPSLQKLQKEGEAGSRKLNQYTKLLTVGVVLVQGSGYLVNLRTQYAAAITMSAGLFTITALVMHAGGDYVLSLDGG